MRNYQSDALLIQVFFNKSKSGPERHFSGWFIKNNKTKISFRSFSQFKNWWNKIEIQEGNHMYSTRKPFSITLCHDGCDQTKVVFKNYSRFLEFQNSVDKSLKFEINEFPRTKKGIDALRVCMEKSK